MYQLLEGITHKKIYILEGHTSTQKLRMDQEDTVRSEPALYDTASLSYGLHYVYQLVESITRKKYILEGHTCTQKMLMDQGNTMRPKPALYDAHLWVTPSTRCTS